MATTLMIKAKIQTRHRINIFCIEHTRTSPCPRKESCNGTIGVRSTVPGASRRIARKFDIWANADDVVVEEHDLEGQRETRMQESNQDNEQSGCLCFRLVTTLNQCVTRKRGMQKGLR